MYFVLFRLTKKRSVKLLCVFFVVVGFFFWFFFRTPAIDSALFVCIGLFVLFVLVGWLVGLVWFVLFVWLVGLVWLFACLFVTCVNVCITDLSAVPRHSMCNFI